MSSNLEKETVVKWFRVVLKENIHFLVNELDCNVNLYSKLVSLDVLTMSEVDDIQAEKPSQKAWTLVKLLQMKGDMSFCAFLDSLQAGDQKNIAETLIADIKYKSTNNAREQNVDQNINQYIRDNFNQSTTAEQKKIASELVLKTDYDDVLSDYKRLLVKMEGKLNELTKEKQNHQNTQDSHDDMIDCFKKGQAEIQKLQKEKDNFEVKWMKSLETIKELEEEMAKLQEQLDASMPSSIEPPANPQLQTAESDELREVREAHQKEVKELTEQVAKLQAKINELEVIGTTTKVYDTPTYLSDSGEDRCHLSSSERIAIGQLVDELQNVQNHHNAVTIEQIEQIKQIVSEPKRQHRPSAKQESDMERQAGTEREENIAVNVNKRTQQDALNRRIPYELNTSSFPTGSLPNRLISRTTTTPLRIMSTPAPQQPHSPKKTRTTEGSPWKRQEWSSSSSHYQQVPTSRREFPLRPAATGKFPTLRCCTTPRQHTKLLYNPLY